MVCQYAGFRTKADLANEALQLVLSCDLPAIDDVAELTVSIAVCAPGKLEDDCTAYRPTNATTNYKPTGLLQKYGQADALSRVQFGLMTGSYSKNKSGGVLRKNIGLLTGNTTASNNEINSATGQFINQGTTDAGIINTLNRIRIAGWDYGGNGVHVNGCNSPGIASFNDGQCVDWGNPLSEMYLESLRYFAGRSGPTSAFDSNSNEQTHLPSLPKVTWADPLPSTEWCAMASTVVLSTGLNSFDSDQLSNDLSIDASSLTNNVGSKEGISGTYLIGNNGSTNDGQCTPKSLTALANATGVCPEVPALEGGYHIAGLAYHAARNMTAPALTGAQKSHLRSLGQTMDCQLVIGREGVTAPVVAELEKLFARHELIKVKLLAERDERPALCATIEEKTGAAEAASVGKTAIFYRQAADPERRTIELPAPKVKPVE